MLENLTNQDIIILCCLVGLILVVGLVCIILTLKSNKKGKKDKKELDIVEPDINMALATDNIPAISEEEPVLDELLNEEEIEREEVEEAQIPNEQMEEEQDEKNRSTIEEVLKAMNQDLEKQKYETIDKYEEEQEENAVISYQELVARKLALAESEEENKTVEETLTKTSYIEDEDGMTPVSFEKVQLTEPLIENSNSKFANSEFISPVFGRLESTMEYPTLKKTVETETFTNTKLSDEELPQETDEFLNTLKEFRKNL